MADFYVADLSATYRYTDARGCEQDLPLVRYGETLLSEPPARAWNLPLTEYRLVGRTWGYAEPAGNATLSLSLRCIMAQADGKGLALAEARRAEYALHMHRAGTLLLCEAYREGVPLLVTRWQAMVVNVGAELCSQDNAPPLPGGQARLEVEFLLTMKEDV